MLCGGDAEGPGPSTGYLFQPEVGSLLTVQTAWCVESCGVGMSRRDGLAAGGDSALTPVGEGPSGRPPRILLGWVDAPSHSCDVTLVQCYHDV